MKCVLTSNQSERFSIYVIIFMVIIVYKSYSLNYRTGYKLIKKLIRIKFFSLSFLSDLSF